MTTNQNTKHVIYSTDIDFDNPQHKENFIEYLNDNDLLQDLLDTYDVDSVEEIDLDADCTMYSEYLYDEQDSWYDAEQANLSKELDSEIYCFAHLGLWNGPVVAFRNIGYKLNRILTACTSCDRIEFYVEGKELCFLGYHHDGCNSGIFRTFRKHLTEKTKEQILNKIYNQEWSDFSSLDKYTKKLGPEVAKIYGWKC